MERKQIAIDKKAWAAVVDSLASKRFGLHVVIATLAKINPKSDDPEQFKNIILDLAHLKIKMGLTGNDTISVLKGAIKNIMSSPIELEDDQYWTCVPFLDAPRIEKQTRLVTVNINDNFIPYVSQLKKFLEIKERVLGATTRSIMFYATIKSIHAKKVFKITPEELQAACKVKYPDYGNFKSKYMKPVIENLKENGINISFEEIKSGKRVNYLRFSVDEPGGEIPDKITRAPKIKKSEPKTCKPEERKSAIPSVEQTRKMLAELQN